VLGVPVDSVGAPAGGPACGTELSPQALRALGLVSRLGADDAGDLDVRITGPPRDAATGLVGGCTVAPVVAEVRRATAELVAARSRPLLLGACCALLVGAVAGAADALGEVGLACVDGHLDLYDHVTSPTREAADMPVAVLLGFGEPGLLAASGPAPRLRADRLRVLGARDPDEAADVAEQVTRWGVVHEPPEAIMREPTDYLMPGGLDLPALAGLLRALGRDARLVGASVACYNPAKDPGGRHGRDLVVVLVDALGASA
jgi:arginase